MCIYRVLVVFVDMRCCQLYFTYIYCWYGNINRYEVIATPTDIIMVIEYAGGELFNYIVEKGRVSKLHGN